MEKAVFIIAFFCAYIIQAITGFAGNMFSMPVGTMTIGLNSSIAVLNTMSMIMCGILVVLNIKDVNWREFAKIIVVMIVFMFVGIWINTILPLPFLLKIYGTVIILIGLKNLVFPSTKNLPEWALWLVLVLSGIIQGMFVSGGALMVVYAVQKIKDKQQFRITLSLTWTVLNIIYAALAFQRGYFTDDVLFIILICIPIGFIATFIGNKLQKKVNEDIFLKIVYVLLLVIGVILLVTS